MSILLNEDYRCYVDHGMADDDLWSWDVINDATYESIRSDNDLIAQYKWIDNNLVCGRWTVNCLPYSFQILIEFSDEDFMVKYKLTWL